MAIRDVGIVVSVTVAVLPLVVFANENFRKEYGIARQRIVPIWAGRVGNRRLSGELPYGRWVYVKDNVNFTEPSRQMFLRRRIKVVTEFGDEGYVDWDDVLLLDKGQRNIWMREFSAYKATDRITYQRLGENRARYTLPVSARVWFRKSGVHGPHLFRDIQVTMDYSEAIITAENFVRAMVPERTGTVRYDPRKDKEITLEPEQAERFYSDFSRCAGRIKGIPHKKRGLSFDGIDTFGIIKLCYDQAGVVLFTPDIRIDIGDEVNPPYRPGDILFFKKNGQRGNVYIIAVFIGKRRILYSIKNDKTATGMLDGRGIYRRGTVKYAVSSGRRIVFRKMIVKEHPPDSL